MKRSLSKETEDIKKKPHEILEDRNTTAKKKKKSVYGFNSRLEEREDSSVLGNRKIEITQIEQQRGDGLGWGQEHHLKDLWDRSAGWPVWLRVCLPIQGTWVQTLGRGS